MSFLGKHGHFVLLGFLFSYSLFSQNLVPNPSFETYTTCPTGLSVAHYAAPWYNANAGNTPDLFNTCGAGTFAGVPANRFGDQVPNTGNGYAGVFCYYPPSGISNSREYIGVQLCDSLTGGLSYYVELYISLSDSSQHASDDFGVYFSTNQIIGASNTVLTYTPQVNTPPGVINNNKTGWTKISGNFVANGGERYITLGSFKNDANVNRAAAPNPGSTSFFYNNVYYYIDDVFVGLQLPSVSNDTNVCPGANVSLMAQGGLGYSWSTGTTSASINVAPTVTTKYYVDILGACDTIRDSVQVVITNTLSATITGNVNICTGNNTTLSAGGGASYFWSNSSTTASINISPSTSTIYSLTVTSGACSDTSSVTVNVLPPPQALISNDDTICVGQTILLNASGGLVYLWSTGDTVSSINVSPTVTSSYSVEVSNGICSDFGNVNIVVLPTPALVVSPDTSIYAGKSIVLTASNASAYLWAPSVGLSCNDCRFPIASPTVTTTYYVTIYDDNGCSTTDSIWVMVEQDCAEVYIPSAFSPNGDGNNDRLFLYAKCVKNFHFYIYNRWGEVVYETEELNSAWDGIYKGKELNSAVFTYLFKGSSFADNDLTLYGNITLLR